ncbi:hypothetical protein [Nonomuraea sp. B1E8]|uniref:hypothetical protein n=1 Tax=unclassified Nonomuraea TaxID=2593643 RepID=UPI00325D6985
MWQIPERVCRIDGFLGRAPPPTPLRLAEQLGHHEQVQQLQRVVDGLGLQPLRGGQQRGQPPRGGMLLQLGGVRGQAVRGKLVQPPLRHRGVQLRPAELGAADLGHQIQRLDHLRPGRLRRAGPPALQIRDLLTRQHLQQQVQRRPLLRAEQRGQGIVQVPRGPFPLARNQPGQRADPRQQHVVLTQPPHRVLEQRGRAVAGVPRVRPHLARQLSLGRGEVLQPKRLGDLPGVLEPRLVPLGVTLHAGRILDPQLAIDDVQDLVRHLQRIGQKASQVANGHELESEAASDVPAPMPLDEGHVLVVEEEDLLHLGPGGRTVVTAVLRRF